MLTIPPVPPEFTCPFRAEPKLPHTQELSPRHLEQYRALRRWEDDLQDPETKPVVDPDVTAFIARLNSFAGEHARWHRERELERHLQWPAFFLARQPRSLLLAPLATQIASGMLASGDMHGIRNGTVAADAVSVANAILDHLGIK